MNPTLVQTEQIRVAGKLININALTKDQLDDYTASKIEKITRRTLQHLQKVDMKDASLRDLTVCVDTLVKTSRLIRNQSTSNVAVSGRVDAINRVVMLSGRLEQALEGKDRSTSVMIPARAESIDTSNNGNSCQLPIPAGDSQVIEGETVEGELLPATRKPSRYKPTGRKRGRPAKAQATPPPAPGGCPTSGGGEE